MKRFSILFVLLAACGGTAQPRQVDPGTTSGDETRSPTRDLTSSGAIEPLAPEAYAHHREMSRVDLGGGVVARTLSPSMSFDDGSRQDYLLLFDIEGHSYEVASLGLHESDCAGFERDFTPEIEVRDLGGVRAVIVGVHEWLSDYSERPECTSLRGSAQRMLVCGMVAGRPSCWIDLELSRELVETTWENPDCDEVPDELVHTDERYNRTADEIIGELDRCLRSNGADCGSDEARYTSVGTGVNCSGAG